MRNLIAFIVVVFCMLALCSAKLKIPSYYSDNMVIQRNTEQCVPGFADPGSSIALTVLRKTIRTNADAAGRFQICFNAEDVQRESFEITISESNSVTRKCDLIVLKNVVFGEVFSCSGQSNIQMTLGLTFGGREEIANANYQNVRFLTVSLNFTDTPQDYLNHELSVAWNPAVPHVLGGPNWKHTTAVCYYFAKKMYSALRERVPIGIVSSSQTGTPVEAWSSPDALNRCPQSTFINPASSPSSIEAKRASVLWNAMINPLLSMRMRGVVWWQGEGNLSNQTVWLCNTREMIKDWRQKFGIRDLPFFVVEPGPYNLVSQGYQSFANLRLLLQQTGLQKVFFIPTGDLGDRQTDLEALQNATIKQDYGGLFGIHQRNKKEVGYRIADMALDVLFNSLRVKPPKFSDTEVVRNRDGSKSISIKIENGKNLKFRPTADCYLCCGSSGYANTFELLRNGTWTAPSSIQIRGQNAVLLEGENIDLVTQVRYAYMNYPQCMLYNDEEWPVPVFVEDVKQRGGRGILSRLTERILSL